MRKRLLSVLLVLCMVFTILPVSAMAEKTSVASGASEETTAFALPTEAEKPLGAEAPVLGSSVIVREVEIFANLQWYIDNVADDLYLKLADEYYENNGTLTIPAGNPYNITIDLNGKTLQGLPDPPLEQSGNAIEHRGSGTLTIVDNGVGGGTVSAGDNFIAIYNVGPGNVSVKGGTVSGGYAGIYNEYTGNVSVSGGTVYSKYGSAIYVYRTGKITISGSATLTSAGSAVGTITLVNGTNSNTVLEISGGTIENTATNGTAIQNNGTGIIVIPGAGGPVVIRGNGKAMNTAPELGAGMLAAASDQFEGTSPAPEYNPNDIGTYKYLKFEQSVAQIGSTGYASLQAAVDAVREQNQTVKLLMDITENITVSDTNTYSFTLDVNGKMLHAANESPVIMHMGSGKLTLTGGTVTSTHEIAPAICNYGAGSVSVTGGAVKSAYIAIDNLSTGSVSISGGTVQNAGTGCAISTYASGKIYISGTALITSACDNAEMGTIWIHGDTAEDTVLVITGGTIENTAESGNAVYNEGSGKIAISSGTPVIRGRGMAMNTAPDLSGYTQVYVTASTNYDGSSPVEKYKAADINTYQYLGFEQGYVAIIGKVAFISFEEAVKVVENNQTITLLDNVWNQIKLTEGDTRSFTLDLNGYVYGGGYGTYIEHYGSGTLTITDTKGGGKVSGKGNGTVVLEGGSLVVEGGTVEHTAGLGAIYNFGSGSVSILGGTVKTQNFSAIINNSTGKITIGGDATVTSAVPASVGGNASGTIRLGAGSSSTTTLEITGGTIENTAEDGIAIYNGGSGKIAISSGTPVIRGKGKVMNKAPDLSTYVRPVVTASTNYDGSSPVDVYNANNIASYKYIKVEQSTSEVAEIGVVGYPSLAAAVSAVTNGQTIKLLKNASAAIIFTGEQSFTLNLNGKTLEGNAGAVIDHRGSGTLTITDTAGGGTITTSVNTITINVNSSGGLVLEGGTVENGFAFSTSGIAIMNNASGSVRVDGGEVKNTATGVAIANGLNSTGKITIGGTAKITSKATGSDRGTITLVGGTEGDIILEITGGTIENTASGYGIHNSKNGKIVISSGAPAIIKGGNAAMNVVPDLTGFTKVQVTASTNSNGTSPVAEYNPAEIAKYKYLNFAAITDTTVTNFDLAISMNAPVTGHTPATTITNGQYTGTVQWTGNPVTFLGNTVYTATVTLKASNGYTFSGVAENVFTHAGATSVTHARGYGKTLAVTIVFRETPVLQSIKVTTPPEKTMYMYGETFSTQGMVVKATYSDSTEGPNFTGYTVDKTGPLSMSDTTITLTANGTNITDEVHITVSKADGPNAPTDLVGVGPTTLGGTDGKITGTTAAMEYADNTEFSGAISCSGIEITGLAEGTYYVRIKATDTHEAGAYATVTVPSPADKSALHSAIANANTAKGSVVVSVDGSDVDTASKWVTQPEMDALNAVIANAEAVKNDPSATQSEVDEAAQELENAISVFNAAKKNGTYTEPVVDKTELIQTIANANTAKASVEVSVDGSDIDSGSKWVTQPEIDALNAAIATAETVKNDPTATQDAVNTAKQDLESAVSVFNATKKNGTKTGGGTTLPSIEVSETNVAALDGAKDNIIVTAMPGAFSQPVELRLTDDAAAVNEFNALLGSNNGTVLAFDISLYIKGTDSKTQPNAGYAVTIRIPLPQNLWDVRDTVKIGHIKNGNVEILPSSLVWENGMWYIVFQAESFSPYALLAGGGGAGPNTSSSNGRRIAVTGVTLNKSKMNLVWTHSETLIATVTPANATNKHVTWSSSDPSVATVDENGTVTSVWEGKATITVTTRDGGHSDSCVVTVASIEVPKTGDGNDMTGWIVTLAVSVVGVLSVFAWRKWRKIRGTW